MVVPVRRLASRLEGDIRSPPDHSKVFRRSVRGVVGVRSAGDGVRGTALRRRASAPSLPDWHRRALRRRRSVQIRWRLGVGPRGPDAMGIICACRVRLLVNKTGGNRKAPRRRKGKPPPQRGRPPLARKKAKKSLVLTARWAESNREQQRATESNREQQRATESNREQQ